MSEMQSLTSAQWNDFLAQYPDAHFMQTSAWGELKSAFGWQVQRIATEHSGAQVLFRRLPLGFTLAYLPRGPVGKHWHDLWPYIDRVCRKRRAVFLKVEPDLWTGNRQTLAGSLPSGFRLGFHSIQPPNTMIVSLKADEADILAQMKQKTRYNIRLALKKGVVVRSSADVDAFYSLLEETGTRDRFGIHSREYYQKLFELFHPAGSCTLLIAEYQRQPLAGLIVVARGRRAWYLYGASTSLHRNRMPNYLLQWEAMRWAKSRGCTEYDLWGIPDVDETELETGFTQRSNGLWGVYRFKRGFGGQVQRALGPWDRVYHPLLYGMYCAWVRFSQR
jgi:lipid II:glycine glycyltransferase (peptidoglycan interpeptide bridge formation enzyme)